MLNYYDTAIDQVVINANNPTPQEQKYLIEHYGCLLYTSPSPRDS